MEENKVYKCLNLEIYEDVCGEICINCDEVSPAQIVTFDECAAEKMCKCIMGIAQQIRNKQAKEEQ